MNKVDQSGFTLIELIVYMGLLGILLAVMSEVFLGILATKVESESNSQVVVDGNFIHARITYDIRRADRIIAPSIGQTSAGITLGIIEGGVEQVYQYAVVGNTLTITQGNNTDVLNGSSTRISQFSVTRIGNSETMESAKDTLSIAYTVQSVYELRQGPDELPFQLTAGLR